MEQNKERVGLGRRWSDARPTKTVAFWSCVASVVVTMILGFSWGGWVTGGTARTLAAAMAEDAVVARLAPICVLQFTQDPQKDQKLVALKDESTWRRGDYVRQQGWATMPGEQEPDSKIADECVNRLMLIS